MHMVRQQVPMCMVRLQAPMYSKTCMCVLEVSVFQHVYVRVVKLWKVNQVVSEVMCVCMHILTFFIWDTVVHDNKVWFIHIHAIQRTKS